MTDGRCASCRHWLNEAHRPADADTEIGYCALAETEFGRRKHSESLALAETFDDGARAWLATYRDFGCVQWEKRNDD